MKFTSFKIENYKGIQNVTLNMVPEGGDIFTLVGLNESGKTSILEAISQFNPAMQEDGEEIRQLYSTSVEDIEPVRLIPKHLRSNFGGEITIEATLSLTNKDKERIIFDVNSENSYSYEINSLSDSIVISHNFFFESSTYEKKVNYITFGFSYKEKSKRTKWKETSLFSKDTLSREFHDFIYSCIKKLIPSIYYFPTFIFNQPEKIKISGSNQNVIDKIYTKILDNIAHATPNKLDLNEHVIKRAFSDDESVKETLQSALDQMSALITDRVFELWRNILQGDVSGKEILLVLTKDSSSNVYIQFQVKQGTSRYSFIERSLGFRWFFSFLLFTLFNQKENDRNILFLLDEPASNLHAKAQEELLKSFDKVTQNGNQIIYSTHSHYLINPMWLDQAYIVSNQATNYDYIDDRDQPLNENTLVSLDTYRNYVKNNPTKTTYFQPILDKLNVTPSMLDCVKPSVLVEGKSDYLILEYARRILLDADDNIGILPLGGATKCEALISILKGWGVPFFIIFDDDAAGKNMAKKVKEDYILSDNSAITLKYFDEELEGKEISGLLSESDLTRIREHFNKDHRPSPKNDKSAIQLFFSEHLASRTKVELSGEFMEKVKSINQKIVDYFSQIS
ncbi:ATP-dependent nuclease [Actinobacillus equuli]|uniref:ATP-dependent nuclease n=1 Tax=Actinobacillus equuli TaxID=718 RepID=UPI002440F13F|nr:AAA family ATPase [Actinobacillus equuli]WGE47337.1 AAA family ATPase [Actinobacillus equuli subsp. haemolyticus]